MMQMTQARQALQVTLTTTVERNGLTRSLWAKQQQPRQEANRQAVTIY